jgi:hypothetical protein
MWEFIAFVLFGWAGFVMGGAYVVRARMERAIKSGMFEYDGVFYRVTKTPDK